MHSANGERTLTRAPPTWSASCFHFSGEGQAGSPGRTREVGAAAIARAAEAEEREARGGEAKRARELEQSSSAEAMARRFGHLDESMAQPFTVKNRADHLA